MKIFFKYRTLQKAYNELTKNPAALNKERKVDLKHDIITMLNVLCEANVITSAECLKAMEVIDI